ncbi:Tetracycline repressor protein class D [Zhongshania aliphaticivorans]|uniref:Tetracycline repressor protein class D n=2 Tax=Zhongshania aliphaticivorans TaxID=1470434 RepID=A0A5S9NBY5_9GAMM|nr:Tetracycline repressor protein class D [Zhongshania aliphaticivorans]CAA0115344.1 Tetracycline repressor protein class D [Zhongshania aliphaticivorans]CAA0120165.1 Tetracycline repressor protein class D [Zhongshania aliphaticivorans]
MTMNMINTNTSYHHGNLRQELMALAEQHLVNDGIGELSLRALAREIGVSQTAPYRHFKDKNALLAALATEGFKRFFDYCIPSEQEARADISLLYFGLGYVKFAKAHTEMFHLMFGPVLQPRNEYPELFSAGREAIYKVRAGVERGFKTGELRELDDAASIAHTVWGAVHGVATLMLDHADTYGYHRDVDLQAEKSLRMMIAGLCTDPTEISQLPTTLTPYPPEE